MNRYRAGHPQEFGLRLGAQDWLKEEAMLLLSQRELVGQEQRGEQCLNFWKTH